MTGIYYDALMDRERAERGEAYLHTFHDVLVDTGYWVVLLEGATDALPLLVNEDLRPHQREYLQLLGIPESRLLKVPRGQVIRCRELVVPTTLRNHPQMAAGLQWIRHRLGRLLAPESEANDLLYASRRDAARRRMLNEADLEEALAGLGFRVIVAGSMPVSEQIAAFVSPLARRRGECAPCRAHGLNSSV